MTPRPWTRADDDALDALLALTAADPYATPIPCRKITLEAAVAVQGVGYSWRGEGNGNGK